MHHRPPHLFDKLRTDCADVGVRVLMAQRRVQSNLTQQTPEQVIASLNHDTTASQPLADVFNKTAVHQNLADIQAITSAIGAVSAEYKGWATVDARIAQLTAELKFKELNEQAAQKQKELTKTQADINAVHNDGSAVTPEELAQLKQLTDQLNQISLLSLGQVQIDKASQAQIDQWSPNGSKGKYLTSITNALTTQLTGQTPYAALFAGARNLLAEQLHDQNTAERVIGHALIACAVAIVSGTNCGTAAAGATASVAIADTFANLFTKQPNGQYSNQQKEAISALTTIAIGIATAATGGDTTQAYTAADAAKNEVENNATGFPGDPLIGIINSVNEHNIYALPNVESPHYVSVTLSLPRGPVANKGVKIAVNLQNGEVYMGVVGGFDSSLKGSMSGVSASMGWITNMTDRERSDLSSTISAALDGASVGGSACVLFVCGGASQGVGSPRSYHTIDFGVSTDKFAVSGGGETMVLVGRFKR